jgi:hypothetical protein
VPPNTGSVISSDPRAAAQAKSIGATIGGDGWWYKDGKKLSTKEADRLTNEAGTAITSTDTAHGERARDIWGRGSDLVSKGYAATGLNKVKIGGWVGDTYERNKGDILAAAGTVATGGNPLVGAAIKAGMEGAKRGASAKDTLMGAASGYGAGVTGAGVAGAAKGAMTASGSGLGNILKGGYTGAKAGMTGAAKQSRSTLGRIFGGPSATSASAPATDVTNIGATQTVSQAAPIPIPPPVTIPPQGTPSVPLPKFLTQPIGKTGISAKDIWGFATADKNKDMVKAGMDLFSGATKQKGQMAEQDFESGKQRMEYNKGMIAAQKQDFDAIELEKRRKQQMGEMLMKMLGAGFFANKGGSYEPPR